MRRAVLGGSFDPVHRGHVAMAHAVLDADLAEFIHIVPAWLSPFKGKSSAPIADRLTMVRHAFPCHNSMQIETLEVEAEQKSFTIDTLAQLSERYPEDSLSLIIGADNLPELHRWHRVEEIAEFADLIILGRGQSTLKDCIWEKSGFSKSRVFTLPDFDYSVSSSGVRQLLLKGIVPWDDLSLEVVDYIRSHGLYQTA